MRQVEVVPFLLVFILLPVILAFSAPEIDWAEQRSRMVEEQIEDRGVSDPEVLRAMRRVPRHLFVPERYRYAAYEDRPLPIGEGQTISQPYIVALMTQLADVDSGERVLEVGTGSGYQAAVLGRLAGAVYTVEIVQELGREARQRLREQGYDNVHVKIGDGFRGWPEHAPFDAIVVTCAPPEIPRPLKDQLAAEGRLVIPVGENWQQLKVLEKSEDGNVSKRSVIPVRFVPMTGEGVREMQYTDP